jgi:hypothetical protein
MQVVSDDPIAPRQHQPGLPADLETICLKCLNKDPRQRYPSAVALANDLRRFVEGDAVKARRSRPWDALFKWVRGNPAIAALIGVVGVLFLLGLVQAFFRFR